MTPVNASGGATLNGDDGLTGQDWIGIIMASNEAALQWASMFTDKPVPTTGNVFSMTPSGVSIGGSGQWILIGGALLLVLVLLRK